MLEILKKLVDAHFNSEMAILELMKYLDKDQTKELSEYMTKHAHFTNAITMFPEIAQLMDSLTKKEAIKNV